MKKLIAFGDSFAQYVWPMWPDLLAQNFDVAENYGRAGCSNSYIFNSFMTHLLTTGFNQNDTVVIEWTEPARLDYIKHGRWVTEGSKSIEHMIKQGLGHYFSNETLILQHLSMITAVTRFLAESRCEWYFIFLNQPSIPFNACIDFQSTNALTKRYNNLIRFLYKFKDHIIDEVSMTDFFSSKEMALNKCATLDNGKLKFFKDGHPTPRYTLQFLEEVLGKRMKIDNIDAVRKFSHAAQFEIESQKEKNKINLIKTSKFFDSYAELNNYKRAFTHL